MRIGLAIDSFKGSLTSAQAEEAVSTAIHGLIPGCEICQIPVSDGGEGLISTIRSVIGGREVMVNAHDPLLRPIQTRYAILEDGETVIETAKVCGLTLLRTPERDSFQTSSYGLGEVIGHALGKGCRRFIIGLGGSATNDAGLGMMQALGLRLYNKLREPVQACGKNLAQIDQMDTSMLNPALRESVFKVACDVNNPFCGEKGATVTFAPQKGALPWQVEELEKGMRNAARLIRAQTGKNIHAIPGTGAAGGLGGAFLAFLNATLQPGMELVSERLRIESRLDKMDLIITGEGKADAQTLMGKAPYGMLQLAKRHNIPILLIAGLVEDVRLLEQAGFNKIIQSTPVRQALSKAMNPLTAKRNITNAITHTLPELIRECGL